MTAEPAPDAHRTREERVDALIAAGYPRAEAEFIVSLSFPDGQRDGELH